MAAQGYRGEPETKTKEDESNASLYIAVSMYIYFTVGTKGPWVMAFHQRRDDDDENKHAVGHRRNWTDVVVLGKNEMRAESASREPRKKKKHAARLREAFPQLCNGRDKRLPSRQQERARCPSATFFVWSTRVYTRAKLVALELFNVSGSRKA